jgi:hypothetical protein
MSFYLYNKQSGRKLTHPKYGIWLAPTLEDAKKMLTACHNYVSVLEVPNMTEQFVIMDAETSQEIKLS